MSITRTFSLLAMSLLFFGCAREPVSPPPPPHVWSQSLSEEETARCKQVAWDAAHSQEMAERFKLKRTTAAPMKLETNGIQYYLDRDRRDKVEVAIPDSGHVDFHGYYIGVTVARDTFQVLGMRERFWP
jgi:hypothetical protein